MHFHFSTTDHLLAICTVRGNDNIQLRDGRHGDGPDDRGFQRQDQSMRRPSMPSRTLSSCLLESFPEMCLKPLSFCSGRPLQGRLKFTRASVYSTVGLTLQSPVCTPSRSLLPVTTVRRLVSRGLSSSSHRVMPENKHAAMEPVVRMESS